MTPIGVFIAKTVAIITAVIIIPAVMTSCLRESSQGEEQENNVSLNTRAVPPGMMNNAALYVFDNAGTYIGKQFNVTKTGDVISTYMPVATWNIGLITGEDVDITADPQFSTPPKSGGNLQSPMWKTATYTDAAISKELLNEVPEILYVPLRNVTINPNVTTYIDENRARLLRNVCKVQFVLRSHEGFDNMVAETKHLNAFIDLLNVPTTISWEGKYLPDRNTPDVAKDASNNPVPIRKYLNFKNVAGTMRADTVNFIIPAHRADGDGGTTHKLKFQISMPIGGNPFYGKSVTPINISASPQTNEVIGVAITKFSGEPGTELDIKVTVRDWYGEVNQNVEFN